MFTTSSRSFSPYEATHLKRFGVDASLVSVDDTTPVEYLTGQVEFDGTVFLVTPDVLIPRVETEELLDKVLAEVAGKFEKVHWAEIGTGSGALGLSLAKRLAADRITSEGFLSDISPAALSVARENAERVGVEVNFLESDLFASYPRELKFEIILANLPYIPSARIVTLDAAVRDHEPHLALDGGPDGFELIAKLLTQLPHRIAPNGRAWLEIDHTHDQTLWDRYLSELGLQDSLRIELLPDQFEQNRFAVIRLLS